MTCKKTRELLLAHLYEALDDAEERALREHLEGCPDCAAALETARRDRELLAEAASLAAPEVAFRPPPRRGRVYALLAAAAALLLLAGGAWLYRDHARQVVALETPRLIVTGPASAPADQPAEFHLKAERVDGTPWTGNVVLALSGADGRDLGRAGASRDGEGWATYSLPAGVGEPGEAVRLDFESGERTLATSVLVRDDSRLAARAGTDKPLYRPGEPVRIRAVLLERFRLTPAAPRQIRVQVTDPRGSVVFETFEQSAQGVGAAVFPLPAGAVGGLYTVKVTDPQGAFPEAAREFTVRSYRVPRLKLDVELDRDSYAPGEDGRATVAVERAEGGFPAGAKVRGVLTVDGAPSGVVDAVVDAAGGVTVPFTLPGEIQEGRGLLSVTVRDGGVVETATETVSISLGRLDVALYPEGGDLVAGLPARVYFTVRDPAGEPAELTADVVNAAGKTVASAETVVRGMGRFELDPVSGETYRLVPRTPADVELSGAEIAPIAAGAVLRTLDDEIPPGAEVRLELASSADGDHSVGVWCRGVLIGETTVALAAGSARRVDVPTAADAGGVLRVTVLDPDGTPRAERLVSRAPARSVAVTAVPDRAEVSPGERVRVKLLSTDETGAPVPAFLGVTVVDDAVLALADDEDTASLPLHFLLGMEVQELAEVAVYTDGDEAREAVDLLLGTQGWRRFAWVEPEAFFARHAENGRRVVPAGKAETSTLVLDTGAATRRRIERERTEIDARRLPAAGLLVLAIFLGGGLLVVLRRAGSLAKLSLATGSGLSLAMALLLLFGAGIGSDPATAPRTMMPPAVDTRTFIDAEEWGEAEGGPATGAPEAAFEDGLAVGGEAVPLPRAAAPMEPNDVVNQLALAGEDLPARDARLDELRDGREMDRVIAEGGLRREMGIGGGAGGIFGGRGGGGGAVGDRYYRAQSYWLGREYAHNRMPSSGPGRSDFTEVLYWAPLVVTGEDGRAEIEFATSDSVTTFQVLAEAHDRRGALGTGEGSIRNRIPFYLEPKLPPALSTGDVLYLPAVAANATAGSLSVTLALDRDEALLDLEGEAVRIVDLAGTERKRVLYELTAKQGRGDAAVVLSGVTGNLEDQVRRTIPIVPRGYPVTEDRAGALEKVDATEALLPAEMDRTTLTGSLRLYPSVTATLTDGLESMLRSPGGCFEQASSSNYPNVMILTLLEQGGNVPPATARKAKQMLDRGYQLLTGYECDAKGYEWFGRNPGHQALTAYGLMEFADMAKVYDVDTSMVDRTRDWILSQRDGEGGFNRGSTTALDTFGRAPRPIEEAYLVWALTEAGVGAEIERELTTLRDRAVRSEDPYLEALAALALLNAGRDAEAGDLVADLLARQQDDGSLAGKETSVTSSRGANLTVETTALAGAALLQAGEKAAAEKAVRYLTSRRKSGGRFGATQATILALRTLVMYAKEMGQTETAHDLTIFVNGRPVADRHVPAGAEGVIVFEREVLDALVPGKNEIELRTTGAEVLPWGLSLNYKTSVPPSDPDCAVGIETKLAQVEVEEGGTVELAVTIENREDGEIPMVLARVGLPAGLLPRPKQLEELKDAGEIAFFETRPREVTIYLDGMTPRATKKIVLQLVADVPGRFEGPATSAYLFYTDDVQTWASPLKVHIPAAK